MSAPARNPAPTESLRVLFVEDDHVIASMIEMYLVLEGFEVSHVGDGTSAVHAVDAMCPHVVLLDIMLPGRNGLDVARWIREQSPHRDVGIVMLTSLAGEEQVREGLLAGADAYVRKPVELSLVADEIRRVRTERVASGRPAAT